MHGMKWKEKEWESREGRETEMDRIKMGEFPHQNSRVEHGILRRHARESHANTRHTDEKSGNVKCCISHFKGD